MSCIPSFAVFYGKWLILFSILETNNIYILLPVILSFFLVLFSCLKIIKIMYFENSNFQFNIELNTRLKIIMLLGLIINIFLFIVLFPLADLILNASN